MEMVAIFFRGFSPSDVLSIISLALAVIGVGLAVYFYFKQKQIKRPYYRTATAQIISADQVSRHNLKVTLADQEVPNLSVCKIAIWNGGNVSIRKSDCIGPHCLQITSLNEVRILNAAVIGETISDLTKSVEFDQHAGSVNVNFDFLRPGEGFVFSVAYQGVAPARPEVRISLIDGKSLCRVRGISGFAGFSFVNQKNRKLAKLLTKALPMVFCITGLGMFAVPLVAKIYGSYDKGSLMLVPMGVIYFAQGWLIRNRMPAKLLDAFLD